MQESIVAVLVPTGLIAQVPEWHREVLIKANYGNKGDEYGYPGVSRKEETSPVSAFYVGEKNIYIEDYYQGNVKVYDLSGTFLRTITLERGAPRKVRNRMVAAPAPHNICDFLVYNDVIYMLCEDDLNPTSGRAAVNLRSYDLATGKSIKKLDIWNSRIGRWSDKGASAHGSTTLATGPSGIVWINDLVNQVSIPILRDGKEVSAAEQTQPVSGLTSGSRRIRINAEAGVQELVNGDGSFVRNLGFIGSDDNVMDPWASSKNGEYLMRRNGSFKMVVYTISTWDGRDIGRVVRQPEKVWWSEPFDDPMQVGPDGALYAVHPAYDCLYVYRWSR